jgi:hypothetical protein
VAVLSWQAAKLLRLLISMRCGCSVFVQVSPWSVYRHLPKPVLLVSLRGLALP